MPVFIETEEVNDFGEIISKKGNSQMEIFEIIVK